MLSGFVYIYGSENNLRGFNIPLMVLIQLMESGERPNLVFHREHIPQGFILAV